jgi:hypothetical protein
LVEEIDILKNVYQIKTNANMQVLENIDAGGFGIKIIGIGDMENDTV